MANILIVGANRGIGLALAQRYVSRGDDVIGTCRHPSPELSKLGVRVEGGVDITSDEAVAALARRLGDARIDVLVLNAGILRSDSLDTVQLAQVREQIETNAIAPLRVTLAVRKNLAKGGKIAAITSRMGSIGDNGSGASYGYRMSKAALNAMAVSLSRDLAGAGISVAILHPGYVRTDMTGHQGGLEPQESARLLIERIDALSPKTSGTFWHANGEVLPW